MNKTKTKNTFDEFEQLACCILLSDSKNAVLTLPVVPVAKYKINTGGGVKYTIIHVKNKALFPLNDPLHH